jgi:outer membrane lipopolysaccharide assembly protein LptE/RlpB
MRIEKKFVLLFFILHLITACGFTPTLKDTGNKESDLVYYEINPQNSYEARQVLNSTFQNLDIIQAKYITKVNISERESAVNVLSSGSVSEYKIEVLISYEIFNISNNLLLYKSQSRGFANYDVSNSEYTNTLVKKEALKRAISDGLQLMNIVVQTKVNKNFK